MKNDELAEYDKAQLALTAYLHSDHFWATTGANGYSGFLQMGLICPIDHRLAPKGILGIQEARGLKDIDASRQPQRKHFGLFAKGGIHKALCRHS